MDERLAVNERQLSYRRVLASKMEGEVEHAFVDASWFNKMMVLYAGGMVEESSTTAKTAPLMFAIVEAEDGKPVRSTNEIVQKFMEDLKF